MKTVLAALLLLALVPAQDAYAHRHHRISLMGGDGCDPPARLARRHDTARVDLAITTEDDGATLILTRRHVAMQLSDRVMHKLDRELRREDREDEDNALAQVIKSAVLGSVRAMLDHSVEYPISAIRDIEYRDGRLVIISVDGDPVFEDVDVNDHDVLDSFSPADARVFVREFDRLKGHASD